MILGFTGTRSGMTAKQRKFVRDFLTEGAFDYAIHGCCVGADEQFNEICRELGIKTVGIPGYSSLDPNDMRYRSDCECDEIREPLPYLPRNQVIVNGSDIVLACPGERKGGGTWYTIKYAESKSKTVKIIHQNGVVDDR